MIASMFLATAVAMAPIGQTSNLSNATTFVAEAGRLAPVGVGGLYAAQPSTDTVVELDAAGAIVNTFAVPEGPLAVAVHPTNGQIYISRRDGVVGIYDSLFVSAGVLDPTPATLAAPGDIEIHPITGEIYVADTSGNQIVVFDNADTFARAWGMTGPLMAEFNAPQSIALDLANDHVIVTDIDNFRAQIFDTAGLYVDRFGYRILFAPLFQAAWFARSGGIDADACGNLYIIDSLMGTLRVFDAGGVELDAGFQPVIGYGSNAGELKNPSDVMIDGGKLYIANAGNGAIEVFDVTCTAPAMGRAASIERISDTKVDRSSRKRATEKVRGPDNPATIVAAINSRTYNYKLDIDGDRSVDFDDLALAVERFGAATVSDFLNPSGVTAMAGGTRTSFEPPHIIDIPNQCGRCHSMDGLPGGMLTADGQENLCHSCHTGVGLAKNTAIDTWGGGNSHPWGVAADAGDVEGPDPASASEMAFHLDNGDIRCGTCHDQHSQENGQPYLRAPIDDIQLCAECHQELESQWRVAGHSDKDGEAFVHYDWSLPNRASCRQCHSGFGYVDWSNGLSSSEQNGAFRVHDCLVCHAAHDKPQDEQLLRVYDEVTLPTEGPDETVTGVGSMATCMACHNGRRAPDDGSLTPHYMLGGVMLEGLNGEDFGNTSLTSSAHTDLVTCADCHMAPSPEPGNPGANKVGEHTFNLAVHDPADPDYGFENVANACQSCHAGLPTLNRTARGDYDGDGAVEGVQDETQGLLDLVYFQITTVYGAIDLGRYPYWGFANVDPADETLVRAAIWNWQYVVNSGDLGVKNTSYAVGLLQLTYEQLAGSVLANAYLRYVPTGATAAANYVGTDGCLSCHGAAAVTGKDYSPFLNNGHPYKLNEIKNAQMPTYPFSTIFPGLGLMGDDDLDPLDPKPGTDNTLGTPLGYSDVSFVIGGFGWKARWIDANGYIVTGSEVQYNLETMAMSSYHDNETDKPYNCGNCHTTGWRHYTSEPGDTRNLNRQNGLPGMDGTFAAPGIGCEACHGAGSDHVAAPAAANITTVATPRTTADFLAADMAFGKAVACSECHTRDGEMDYPSYVGGPGRIAASGGLIRHHEQYDEMIGVDPDDVPGGQTGPHRNLDCTACHDPHTTTKYMAVSGDDPGMNKHCTGCHNAGGIGAKDYPLTGPMAALDCIDCHMPKLIKNAVSHAPVGTGPVTGDIRSHIFAIDLTTTAQFTADGKFSYPRITGAWACNTCHNGVDSFGLGFPNTLTTIHDGSH